MFHAYPGTSDLSLGSRYQGGRNGNQRSSEAPNGAQSSTRARGWMGMERQDQQVGSCVKVRRSSWRVNGFIGEQYRTGWRQQYLQALQAGALKSDTDFHLPGGIRQQRGIEITYGAGSWQCVCLCYWTRMNSNLGLEVGGNISSSAE